MEKLDNIYDKVVAKDNLYRAASLAQRYRRYRQTSADFNFRLEEEVGMLHQQLIERTYCHGPYRLFNVYEPKRRLIAAAPFRDRVVHHAVHDVIEPVVDRIFIYDSYACRRGKGMHKAVDRAQAFLRANKFCLHGDIRKYFPSIDHGILKSIIRRRIADNAILWLLDEIIDSALPLAGGLPIGNLTSQFFANLYLNELDHFVKHRLRMRYYIRYMDDFLIFSEVKPVLLNCKEILREFLRDTLKLRLHEEKTQIYETANGLKFLGLRLYKNFRRLSTQNVRFFRKRLAYCKILLYRNAISAAGLKDSVRCWVAHSSYAHTGGLRLGIFRGLSARDAILANLLREVLI
jgi:retron-type reverse transcriptase